ncbi:hypothetical protein Ppa06_55700 [Planomonospora parontospora subsp. parontospora]|uniref:Uncharacterized protein n=2 Tax=Planomonospora parontospora TaxID=58119 RepID=A0AA37BJK4_9ACTN|nr:hypothetical protein GCM10010126_45840 [Planomonospora parontospora]GII11772.1 hypothetical protein Ppa06_55700 [Planomonospora parontospora subsp. parontospora]
MDVSARDRRLARGASWPLTRSDLREGLGERFEHVRELDFFGEVPSNWPLTVSWRPGRAGGIHPDVYGVELLVQPVRSADRAEIREAFREIVLPELRDWITHAVMATEVWKAAAHRRVWRWTENRVFEPEETP